jgi:hypothetical protein
MTNLLINGELKRGTACYSVITNDAKMGSCFSNCMGVVTMYITMGIANITIAYFNITIACINTSTCMYLYHSFTNIMAFILPSLQE